MQALFLIFYFFLQNLKKVNNGTKSPKYGILETGRDKISWIK